MRSIEPGISRFRAWSFGPSRNDEVLRRFAPRNDGEKAPPSIQQLGVVRRLRRRLDRDRPERPPIRLGAAMCGALRDDDEVARLDLYFLVAEPDRPGAFEDVLHL